jgi:hypothetical protein
MELAKEGEMNGKESMEIKRKDEFCNIRTEDTI